MVFALFSCLLSLKMGMSELILVRILIVSFYWQIPSKNIRHVNEKAARLNLDLYRKKKQVLNCHVIQGGYLVLVFHFFELIPQISKCWSFIRVFLPAFRHYSIPIIGKISRYFTRDGRRDSLMIIIGAFPMRD